MRTKTIGISKCKSCGNENSFSFYNLEIIPDEKSLSLKHQKFYWICRKCGKKQFLAWDKIPVSMKQGTNA